MNIQEAIHYRTDSYIENDLGRFSRSFSIQVQRIKDQHNFIESDIDLLITLSIELTKLV
jgi:hypothetical protein